MKAFFTVMKSILYETMTMTFEELPKFQKEREDLVKKYRSLSKDLQEFRNVVSVIPLGNSKHFSVIAENEILRVIKARLFCQYLN